MVLVLAVVVLSSSGAAAAEKEPAPAPPRGPETAIISGRVLDATGKPIASVCASANVVTGDSYDAVAHALTASDGTYELHVAPGAYLFRFEDCGSGLGLIGATYGVGSGEGGSLPQKQITEAGLTGIDMVMTSGRVLRGRVVDTSGLPVSSACVAVRSTASLAADDWTTTAWAIVDGDTGGWSASVPPGSYALQYVNCDRDGQYQENGRWIEEFHRDLYTDDPLWSDLKTVVVADDTDPSPVYADLLRAAHLTGTVVDVAGDPLADVCISGPGIDNDERTSADGQWRTTLRPGTHTFVFSDCVPGRGLVQATRAVTVSGGSRDSLDVVLRAAAPASVSGRVTNMVGTPVVPACVVAYVPDAVVAIAVGDPGGAWTLHGLGAGSYFLGVFNCDDPTRPMLDPADGTPYPTTWWPAAPADLSRAADPARDGGSLVVLHPGDELTGRNFCLPTGCPAAAPPSSTPRPAAAAPSTPGTGRSGESAAVAGSPQVSPPGAIPPIPAAHGSAPVVERVFGQGRSWHGFVPTSAGSDAGGGVQGDDELGVPTARAVPAPASDDGWWRPIALVSLTTTAALSVLLARNRRRAPRLA